MTDLEKLISLAEIVQSVFKHTAYIENNKPTLDGYCFRASLQLARIAHNQGIDVELGLARYHAFVLLDNIIVDITAMQFGKPDGILVKPLPELKNEYPWQMVSKHKDLNKAIDKWCNGGAQSCSCQHCSNMIKYDPIAVDKEFKNENAE